MAVPEGLPLAVTLSLAFSGKKMLADKNLVRKLYACETMGGANCICSDKTGTLTMNEMHLVSMWNKNRINFEFQPDDKYDLAGGQYNIKNQRTRDLLAMSLTCNASAKWGEITDKDGNIQHKWIGNKTEIALLEWITQCGYNAEEMRAKHIMDDDLRYPFSSSRKRMTTMVDYNGEKILMVKGASEYVMNACENMHVWETDEMIPMNEGLKTEIKEAIHGMARDTLRTICVGYKSCPNVPVGETPNAQGVYPIEEKGFTLLIVTGIRDVLRPTVKASVAKCQIAGIKVRMVTGDNKVTAEAIAKDCGIITGHTLPGYDTKEHVWLGKDFWEHIGGVVKVEKKDKNNKTMMRDGKPIMIDKVANMAAFNGIYKKLDVMARCRPEDKYAMVLGLIANRNVVAVTGDGTNDAPALKRADVGFAMGNAGTEVAREAADIILLDDNFSSIVAAVLWGRNIYDSVRKFLQFQLTINVVAVVVVFISALQT
jgi:Ca2+ transporting ATPase